jgi:hypothetical protein
MAEWTGYQGGKVKEADEGKEKQVKEDPRCKEGNIATSEIQLHFNSLSDLDFAISSNFCYASYVQTKATDAAKGGKKK